MLNGCKNDKERLTSGIRMPRLSVCFSVNINVDLYRIVHEKNFLLHFLAKFSKVAEVTINAKQIESFRSR